MGKPVRQLRDSYFGAGVPLYVCRIESGDFFPYPFFFSRSLEQMNRTGKDARVALTGPFHS